MFLTAAFFFLFLAAVKTFWADGWDVLTGILIPGDPETTVYAAECFLQDIRNGIPLSGAAEAFCRTILYYE